MRKMMNKEIFLKCDCHTEGILVEIDDFEEDNLKGNPEVCMAFYEHTPKRLREKFFFSWKERFKLIWQVLTKGTVYSDMVILNKEKALELVKFIEGAYK
jgi:hypothetical protein